MPELSLAQMVEATGGSLLRGDPETRVGSYEIDTRRLEQGGAFFALKGSRSDGHDYIDRAANRGAAVAVVEREPDPESETPAALLQVDDALAALQRCGEWVRRRLNSTRWIAVTGSNGKTTTKELIAEGLAASHRVYRTPGNINNQLGLPLSLFALEPKHQYAVLELGASKAGDIAYLASIAEPDIGLITNIGPAHLGGFGSEAGVAQAKGELYAALPPEGCAVINADEPWTDDWLGTNRAGRVLTFGHHSDADVRVGGSDQRPRLETAHGGFDLRLALPGIHNRFNAAAATAVALALDIDLEKVRQGLEAVQPVPGRLNLIETAAGWTVIDDTYNANPASLYSALQVLSGMQGTPWLVLGDMKELGTDSPKMHREVGEAARAMGVRHLFATGEMSVYAVDAFGEGAEHFASRDELAVAVRSRLRPGINCLVKGSRSMGMEAVVAAITRDAGMKEAS